VIERLNDMPAGTLGFRVSGEVHREDYTEMLVPQLSAAAASGNGLRTLYVIEGLDEIDPSAMWEDAKTGFDLGVRHHDQWRRSAIVTDQEWLARAARMFAWMIPGEARIYPVAELEQAKAWVAG
jgi:stage II sporulation SpoAA-like protein